MQRTGVELGGGDGGAASTSTRKRLKTDENVGAGGDGEAAEEVKDAIISLRGQDGEQVGPPLKVPLTIEAKNLQVLVNKLLDQEDESKPYSFFIHEVELERDLRTHLQKHGNSLENLEVTFKPQAWFKVLPVSRCSATMTGHSESVLSVHFSPDSRSLASGSGDTTVRIWDLDTQTRLFQCSQHKDWVLCVCWSPDAKYIASGGMDKIICLWNPENGQHMGTLKVRIHRITPHHNTRAGVLVFDC